MSHLHGGGWFANMTGLYSSGYFRQLPEKSFLLHFAKPHLGVDKHWFFYSVGHFIQFISKTLLGN